jgi:hypothetical protein
MPAFFRSCRQDSAATERESEQPGAGSNARPVSLIELGLIILALVLAIDALSGRAVGHRPARLTTDAGSRDWGTEPAPKIRAP